MSEHEQFLAAVKGNDAAMVERLLADDPTLAAARDPNGVSALLLALDHGHAGIVVLLRQRRTDLDLFEAAALGDAAQVAARLDEHPAGLRALSPDGLPVVTLAAFFGRLEVLELLLAHGADAGARSNDGQTPLALAEAAGQQALAALLRASGATA